MKTSAAGLVALRVEVSLREGRMVIGALYAAVQVRPSRRPLCGRQNDDFTVSFGSAAAVRRASSNDRSPPGYGPSPNLVRPHLGREATVAKTGNCQRSQLVD